MVGSGSGKIDFAVEVSPHLTLAALCAPRALHVIGLQMAESSYMPVGKVISAQFELCYA